MFKTFCFIFYILKHLVLKVNKNRHLLYGFFRNNFNFAVNEKITLACRKDHYFMIKTRIKDLREDHDLGQKTLSDYLNISQVAYSYYELGRRSMPIEILCKIADFYNTSVDYLLYRTDTSIPYSKEKEKEEL